MLPFLLFASALAPTTSTQPHPEQRALQQELRRGLQAGSAGSAACLAECDSGTDYFPESKLSSQYSTGWDVTYTNTYKVIEGPSIGKIVAYQCGCAAPNVSDATVTLQVPLRSATLLSTTFITLLELIGERDAIVGVSDPDAVSSPCLREAIEAGNVATVSASNVTTINAAGADAVFAGSWQVSSLAGTTGAVIPVAETAERTGLGAAEWVEFMALFFNQESAVPDHIAQVAARIEDAKTAVQESGSEVKQVLWVYEYFGSLYTGSCPNYYCDAVREAGGQLVDLSGERS